MMDNVSGNAVILERLREGISPRALYSNQQMNEFFECDVAKQDHKDKKAE